MNRIKMMAAAFVAMICVVSVSAQTVEEVKAKYTKAAALLTERKTAEAIPLFEQVISEGLDAGDDAMVFVIEAKKTLPQCYFSKAIGLAKAGKLDEAVVECNRAAELGELYGQPSVTAKSKGMVSKIYRMLATKAFNNKEYAKAAEIFKKGYEANPKDTALGLNLAMSYCEMGDTTGYAIYNNIIALAATHSKYEKDAATAKTKCIYYRMLEASKFAEAKDYDNFYATVDSALEFDPTNADALILAVQVSNNAKAFDKVIAYGDRAIAAQTEPASASNVAFLVASAYENKENKAKAIEYYSKVTAGDNVANAKKQIELLSK